MGRGGIMFSACPSAEYVRAYVSRDILTGLPSTFSLFVCLIVLDYYFVFFANRIENKCVSNSTCEAPLPSKPDQTETPLACEKKSTINVIGK